MNTSEGLFDSLSQVTFEVGQSQSFDFLTFIGLGSSDVVEAEGS